MTEYLATKSNFHGKVIEWYQFPHKGNYTQRKHCFQENKTNKTIARVILKTTTICLPLTICYKYCIEGLLFKFIFKREKFLAA